MQPFVRVTGPVACLPQANIDTDVIIRIERLTAGAREQLGFHAFEALRYRVDGTENPDFPFNRPGFRTAPILVAGANFGCGSSREGAVWALMGMGLRCVIAPSFGDIFYNNCFQNGMLPIVLDETRLAALAERATAGEPLTVDLEQRTLLWPGGVIVGFEIDAMLRQSLLTGLDAIELTLSDAAIIAAWQVGDRAGRPWVWDLDRPQTGRIDLSGGAR
jgi:3-isopropylmalate/(R)-2-methylmalate dehydratase small subunit